MGFFDWFSRGKKPPTPTDPVKAFDLRIDALAGRAGALRKSAAVKIGTQAASSRASFLGNVADRVYDNVLENAYDRGDELEADRLGVELPAKASYAPAALASLAKAGRA
mgnify:CR=1 FL=1